MYKLTGAYEKITTRKVKNSNLGRFVHKHFDNIERSNKRITEIMLGGCIKGLVFRNPSHLVFGTVEPEQV